MLTREESSCSTIEVLAVPSAASCSTSDVSPVSAVISPWSACWNAREVAAEVAVLSGTVRSSKTVNRGWKRMLGGGETRFIRFRPPGWLPKVRSMKSDIRYFSIANLSFIVCRPFAHSVPEERGRTRGNKGDPPRREPRRQGFACRPSTHLGTHHPVIAVAMGRRQNRS